MKILMKAANLPFIFLILTFISVDSFSQKKIAAGSKGTTAELYAAVDLVFINKSKPTENPFDISFGAVFIAPDNSAMTIHGFYNDNREYIIRFSPTSTGTWTYRTFSSVPQLAGLKGEISVAENSNPDVNGAVTIDPENPQKFVFQNGKSYFALAFEIDWLFALDYDNPTDVPKISNIVKEIKTNGFNQAVMNLYAYDVNWKVDENVPREYNFSRPSFSPFKGGNENPDFASLDIDFFKHFDRVVWHLYNHGIVAHVMIYVWNKNVNWPHMYSVDDNRFFDYVIKRYQGYSNIIWDVSKEALDYGRCDIPYINERIQRIRSLDSYKRLITVHDYEYCSRESDMVDFISIQNWRSDLYSLSLEAYLKHNDKPVMNIEHGGYEEGPFLSYQGNYINPETCLIRNYQCVFAGVYSTYYWQNTSWNVVVYDPMDSRYNLKKPRFDYYRHLQELFTRYDYNSLYPAKPKLTTNSIRGMDNLSSSGYPLTNGEGLYLYLVPAENFQVNAIVPEPDNGMIKATWFNPFTGVYTDGGTSKWGRWPGFKNPWENQYSILIVEIDKNHKDKDISSK
jgi:hypothetical protein